jgi:hypothetical protein
MGIHHITVQFVREFLALALLFSCDYKAGMAIGGTVLREFPGDAVDAAKASTVRALDLAGDASVTAYGVGWADTQALT